MHVSPLWQQALACHAQCERLDALDEAALAQALVQAQEQLRRDPLHAKGELVPAHFIQTVNVTHNGKTVMSAEWGPAVAKNPFLHFRFKGGKAGEKLAITWVDNKGDKRTDETTISGG
jgi:thiosulfate oxidation carrier complex protein SoxZ